MTETQLKDLKQKLDYLAAKYETVDFIKNDPVQFPHKFSQKEDIEISAFLSALFAFGKRELFIKKLNQLFCIMNYQPYEYILKDDFSAIKNQDFNYRFIKSDDVIECLKILKILYQKDGGLEKLFSYSYEQAKNKSASSEMFKCVIDYFYARVKNNAGQGFYFMFPSPDKGGAMKRMCMFLRWMVRKSDVDFGIWKFMQPSELLIPLDVHVGNISREMGILNRKANDFKSVCEITALLKTLCPDDPIKYDFAMFGYGVNR